MRGGSARRAAWVLLALATAVSAPAARAGASSRSASAVKWEEGSRAPSDAWTQDDGCPARTGATETRAFSGPREAAWKFGVSGEVEGDPLAARGKTFVVERAGGKRVVHVLATATGVERYRQGFDTALPAAPCVQDGRLVLRTSPRTLQGFAVGERGLSARWTYTAKSAIGPPTLVRDEVYVVVDGTLERLTFGAKDPVWPKAGAAGIHVDGAGAKGAPTEYPRPSVRGASVFLATGRRLVEVDRGGGSLRREGSLAVDADPKSSRVVVGYADVLVFVGRRFKDGESPEARDADAARFGRSDAGPFAKKAGLALPYGVASVGSDWIGVLEKPKPLTTLARLSGANDDVDGAEELATPTVHAEFLESKAPPAAAGDSVFVGGRVFDAATLELQRPESVTAVSRVVPLRDRLLVVESKNRVAAWKSARKPPDVPPLSLLAADGDKAPVVPPAHAVVEDGRVVAGGFVLDAKAQTLRGTGKDAGAWPLATVHALLTDEAPRRLLLASQPADAATAVAAIARATEGAELMALVAKAVEAKDPDLARRVAVAAAQAGVAETDLNASEKGIAALEAKGGARDDEKADVVASSLSALLAKEPDVLVEAAASVPPESPIAYATTLVRAAVDRSPYHGGATDWVRSHLPAGMAPRGFLDLGDWIDFLELYSSSKSSGAAGRAIRVIGPEEKSPEGVPEGVGLALQSARTGWRDDVVGFLNGPLLVVSPPERPGVVAQCLLLGRMVSDALDQAFSSVGPRKSEEEVLVLHLFPNRGEYLARSRGDDEGGGFGGLVLTAGHYDQRANVTRIFLPGASEDSVPGTYVHELTHHWIARRRPPRTAGESTDDAAGGPGYWIVEGFADFVRGFDLDLATSRAQPENPRAEYADVVAALPASGLLPWGRFLSMPQREAYALLEEGKYELALRWHMGSERQFTKGHVYYAQAAATTAYLFLADGGKYRPAVLSFLYDHYAGRSDTDALLTSVGASADELGARIAAWCKSVVGTSK